MNILQEWGLERYQSIRRVVVVGCFHVALAVAVVDWLLIFDGTRNICSYRGSGNNLGTINKVGICILVCLIIGYGKVGLYSSYTWLLAQRDKEVQT